MIITKASVQDLQLILDLQYLAFQYEAKLYNDFSIGPLTQTIGDVMSEYAQGLFLKAMDENDVIIGSVRSERQDDTVLIKKLLVHPKLQGQGIGTRLMSAIEKELPAKRYELSVSTRCPLNIKLYERLGFVRYKEEQISADNAFLYMQKFCAE